MTAVADGRELCEYCGEPCDVMVICEDGGGPFCSDTCVENYERDLVERVRHAREEVQSDLFNYAAELTRNYAALVGKKKP